MKYPQIETFCKRLDKIGIKIKLAGNFPWIYLHSINGKRVTETFRANHGWTVFLYPVELHDAGRYRMTDRRKTFELIRKYIKNVPRVE